MPRKALQKRAAAEYIKYQEYIHREICEQYGSGDVYATPNSNIGCWREQLPYSEIIEQFVIVKTRAYFRQIKFFGASRTVMFQYMEMIADLMTQHLSAYFMHNPEFAKLSDSEKVSAVNNRVKTAIFDDNNYIRWMKRDIDKINKKIAEKEAAAAIPAEAVVDTPKREKRERCRGTKARINKFQDHYAQLVTQMEMAALETVSVKKK